MRCRVAVLALLVAAPATAEPLRLRGDALAGTPAPVGLLTLEGEGSLQSWLSAEALVWLGAGDPDREGELNGDALVIAVRARGLDGRAEGKVGRFVVTAGALRPVHLDGAAGRIRLPRRFDVEAFAGVPVPPGTDARTWDWVVGGRVSRRLGDWGGTGVAVLERRDYGRLDARELGVDASGAWRRVDAGARLAFDLIDPALADVQVTAGTRRGPVRVDVYGQQRSPSHLVPATSLFSVLGDVASQRVGATATWKAAPRLDVVADAGGRRVDHELGAELSVRATLRLDDKGAGSIVTELRRTGAVDGGWTGGRAAARVPFGALVASAELELVVPDDGDRGSVWPWALAALAWNGRCWDAGVAVEASATAEERYRLDVLGRVGRRFEVGP